MTVRCDACGTENRDKAMFCRGCAGKLPAFAITKKPSAEEGTDVRRPALPSADASGSSDATHVLQSKRSSRFLFSGTGRYIVLLALLVVVLGASIVWFMQISSKAGHRAAPPLHGSLPEDPLPPEASLSAGETLAKDSPPGNIARSPPPAYDATSTEAKDEPSSTVPANASTASASSEVAPTDVEAATPSRSTGRRSAVTAQGGGRAPDPRIGCEHLFFAFAARCEANHCQQPAYARHPRCDTVREQRKRDDARRNSMPLS